MILLTTPYVTTVQKTGPGVTQTTTTDTLFVSSVAFDMTTGAIYATIQRGTGKAPFIANMDALQLTVNPDGSFISSDGTWTGAVPSAPVLVASLKTQFDQMVLSSGSIAGTAE